MDENETSETDVESLCYKWTGFDLGLGIEHLAVLTIQTSSDEHFVVNKKLAPWP